MTKTLLAAIGGLAFGFVLATSAYNFQSHSFCRRAPSVAVVRFATTTPAPPVPPCRMAPPAHTVAIADDDDVPSLSFNDSPSGNHFDELADKTLARARAMAKKNPQQARALCRQVMKLYDNNPRVERVRTAFKLLNTITSAYDDDDEE